MLRLLLLCLSGLGIAWAAVAGPQSLAEAPVISVGRQASSGATFSTSQLEAMLAVEPGKSLRRFCSTDLDRGRLLIAARLADEVTQTSADLAEMDRGLDVLEATARRVLACSPYDGYAWLALYWTTGRREGFQSRAFDFLAMSYDVAPREGWIAVRRNVQAAMAFSGLPAPLRAQVSVEWREMVNAQLYEAAAASLSQISEADRPLLFEQREGIHERRWTAFSRFLHARGSEIVLPGAPLLPPRPWR
ncbi:hypothetical protein [Bosea sp. BH3]|uniref:hypothetical protein n=1 Tax=Bosea sp. BH3 TaxID=2871701 RepID=UPI0021CB9147|nr:hypothetical protein [Bosea sp. BH3]MCU4181142.1 hypothetical protein [Bosea sp. BH3]